MPPTEKEEPATESVSWNSATAAPSQLGYSDLIVGTAQFAGRDGSRLSPDQVYEIGQAWAADPGFTSLVVAPMDGSGTLGLQFVYRQHSSRGARELIEQVQRDFPVQATGVDAAGGSVLMVSRAMSNAAEQQFSAGIFQVADGDRGANVELAERLAENPRFLTLAVRGLQRGYGIQFVYRFEEANELSETIEDAMDEFGMGGQGWGSTPSNYSLVVQIDAPPTRRN